MANLFVNPSGEFSNQPTILEAIKMAKQQCQARGVQPDRARMSPYTYFQLGQQTGAFNLVIVEGLVIELVTEFPPGIVAVYNRAYTEWLQQTNAEYLQSVEGIVNDRFEQPRPASNAQEPQLSISDDQSLQNNALRELLRLTPDGTLYLNAQMMGLSDTADAVISMSKKGIQRAVFQGHFELLERMPK